MIQDIRLVLLLEAPLVLEVGSYLFFFGVAGCGLTGASVREFSVVVVTSFLLNHCFSSVSKHKGVYNAAALLLSRA